MSLVRQRICRVRGGVGYLLYKEGRCGVTRKVGIAVRSRAGQCPAPTGWWILYVAALPCCYRRHNLAGIPGKAGCYSQHNLPRRGCYRQHSLGVVIHGTVWFCGAGVVIPDTVQNRCYSRHISVFCAENQVVIGGTFAFGVVIPGTIRRGCYPPHICRCLPRYALLNITLYRLFFCAGLLNTAHFRVLLSAAHFPCFAVVIRSTFHFWVVIDGTIPKTLLFTAQFGKKPGCYSQHISFWGC